MEDFEILHGLGNDMNRREVFEKELYSKYMYLIKDGIYRYKLSYDDSFSAYSDAVLTVIHSFQRQTFEQRSSIKTYLTSIFYNKCIDLVRKNTSAKGKLNQAVSTPDLLTQMPDKVKSVIENLIKDQRVQALLKNFETIGEKCKKILLLYQDDYNDRDIAEKIGYNNAGVVKVTRLRCLEKLKEKMKGFINNE